MSTKMVTPGFRKFKVFWKKGYSVIISTISHPDIYIYIYIYKKQTITNKILLRDSNYIMDVVMWPKFGNSRIFIKNFFITSSLSGFEQKNRFFWDVTLVQVQ